ncbi:GCN5-related N-acetyltransferase, partial [gut metagenome]
ATRHVRHQLLGLSNAPISAVRSPVVAARAFGYLAQRTSLLERMHDKAESWKPEVSSAIQNARNIIHFVIKSERHVLHPAETSLFLEKFGIPTVPFLIAHSLQEAKNHAKKLESPVIMKAMIPGQGHHSEMDDVLLNLYTETEITQAWNHIQNTIKASVPPIQFSGVIIQKTIPHHALREMRLSLTVDHVLGPVIEFGAGGLGAGLYNGQSVALPPLT